MKKKTTLAWKPACIEEGAAGWGAACSHHGLRRLGDLEKAPWARLADALALFPTPHMVHLVDKKFGGELTKADVHIRESWATWNPHREAARQLEAALRAGTVSLQDLQLLQTRRQAAEAMPGTLSREEASARGWAPHPGVFKWPAPKG
ncbi:flagellar associated protein [Haematococcus lacustris]|uniref:Flagellar associated protein n=1 Tax=Haematococcus lacustris TaxID=44745 RepID=A0A699ZYZ1_HAELA|nr:flagellar associated protein [Haematococcus lacustris]